MKRKIIGVTVGSPLPKPNLMQTDPTKGDYVKGKKEFLEQAQGNVDLTGYATEEFVLNKMSELPTKVSEFENDADFVSAEGINEVVADALTQAKESGEFKPVKGVDYWTETDKTEIIDDVVETIGSDSDILRLTPEELETLRDLFGDRINFEYHSAARSRMCTDEICDALLQGKTLGGIAKRWESAALEFVSRRAPYLLY